MQYKVRKSKKFICHITFSDETALIMYYYVPMSINTISSICFSICTALNIMRYEKEITRELRHFNVRRHNNNKQWFVHKHICKRLQINYFVNEMSYMFLKI